MLPTTRKKLQNYLLYSFVFLLPLQTIFIFREIFFESEKWQYGTIGIYMSDIILISLISYSFTSSKELLFNYFKKNKWITGVSILLISLNFLSSIWSLDSILSIYFSIKLLLSICLFFVLQITNFNVKTLILIFISSVFFQSIIGFFQFIIQDTFSFKYLGLKQYTIWQGGTSVMTSESGRWLRSYGGEDHPNILALLLFTAILLSIYLYILYEKNSLLLKIFLLLSISLFSVTVLLTFSRNIWLAFIVGLTFMIIFLFLKNKNLFKRIFIPIILVFATSIIITLTYKDLFFVRISNDTLTSHNSISDRAIYIVHSISLLKEHLFFGTGIGNYTNSIYNLEKNKYPIWHYQPVHNIYLLIFVELGLIGFFLLIFFIIFNLKNIYSQKNKIDFTQFIFILIFFLFLMISLLDHLLWTSHIGLLLIFLIFGISVKPIPLSNHHL